MRLVWDHEVAGSIPATPTKIMQVWFFFNPGAGGDGIANLIERSNNFVPYDGETDWWRIHRLVNNTPKFYAPTPDVNGCFRSNHRFDLNTNQLNTDYQNCILQNQNCVVASHDTSLTALDASDCRDIFCRDQVKVLLLAEPNKSAIDFATKNLVTRLPNAAKETHLDKSKFDFVIDVNRFQTDWQYVYNFCQDVGAELDAEQYHQYQDILQGSKTYMTNNYCVEEYISQIVDRSMTYTLVNTWQPVANKSIT